ncbi:MAG: hypothetical protein ING06_07920 [Roseomonas sp.]|nr:hypothetical protein [Roseomonas sp.]
MDIYGYDKKGRFTGIQCKGKDAGFGGKLTERELRDEVEKAKAFKPTLNVFILATTAPPDVEIQQVARDIDETHKTNGSFHVHVIAWDTLQLLLQKHPDVAERQLGHASTASILKRLDVTDSRGEERHAEVMLAIQQGQGFGVAALPRPGTDQGGDPAEEALRARVKDAAELGNAGSARPALALLNRIREAEWGTASPRSKHRILYAIGFVHLALGSTPKAVQHLRESSAADPGKPWAVTALAFAEMLEDSHDAAFVHAKAALDADATLENAAVALVHAAPVGMALPDLLSVIPEALREKPQVLLALVDAARNRNERDEALRLAEDAYSREPDGWRSQGSLGSELLRPILDIPGIAITKVVPTHLSGQFRRGLELSRKAWNTVASNDYGARMPELALNFSGALLVAGDEDAAKDVLDEALRLAPDHADVNNRLSMIHAGRGELEQALGHLESVPEDKREDRYEIIRLHLLLGLRRYEEVRDAATRLLADLPLGDDRNDTAGLALQAEIALGAGKDRVIASLDFFPDALDVRFAALRFGTLDLDLSQRLRSDVERMLTRLTEAKDILSAADILRATDQPARAAEILAPLTVSDRDTHFLRTRLECLIEADSRREARELFESLAPSLHRVRKYVYIGAKIYDMVGSLKKARQLFQAFLDKNPDDLRARLVWFDLCERTDVLSKALDWLRSVPTKVRGDAPDLMRLAGLMDRHLGDLKCLALGYRALRQSFDDPQIHLSFAFGLFLMGRATKTAKLELETVGPDCAVVLAECEGPGRIVRVIETEPDPRIERDEVPLTDPLALRLIGLRVGSEVNLKAFGREEARYRIETIRSKYLHAHFDVLQRFHERFPEAVGFGTIKVGDERDPNRFDEIYRMTRERAERLGEIGTHYQAGRISMAHLAIACGCSVLDVWDDYRWHKEPKVLAANGSEPERAEAMERLHAANTCVLDPLSIYVATTLGIAETLRDCFPERRLAVTQTTIDYLQEVTVEREQKVDSGYQGSLGWDGERPIMVEVGSEALQTRASWVRMAFEFARRCEIVPAETDGRVRPDAMGLYTALPRAALDSVLAAIGSKGVFLCEDMPLRHVGEIAAEVKGIWIQSLLHFGLTTNRISQKRYSEAVGRLVDAGHKFTSLTAMDLIHELRSNLWMPIGRVERCFTLISGKNNEQNSQTMVIAEFLEIAWMETKGDHRFQAILRSLLRAVETHHSEPTAIFNDWIRVIRVRLERQQATYRDWLLGTTRLAGVRRPPLRRHPIVLAIASQIQHFLSKRDPTPAENELRHKP